MSEQTKQEEKPQTTEETKVQGEVGEKKLYLDEASGEMVSKKYAY